MTIFVAEKLVLKILCKFSVKTHILSLIDLVYDLNDKYY